MGTGLFGGECIERHTASIFDRGGQRRIGPLLDISEIKWERVRDSMTEATVTIEGDACVAQAEFLSSIRSHRHELVIYRGEDRVWEGPIHRFGFFRSSLEIVAHDVMDYLMHTPLSQAYDNTYPNQGPVSTRIGNIIAYELMHDRVQNDVETNLPVTVKGWENLDPPINVLPFLDIHHWPNEAETTIATKPFQMTIGEHMDGLAERSGIDYCTIGRAIHVWDTSRSLGRLDQMTEANFFADVIVTEYGSDHTQSQYTIAQDGLYGSAVNSDLLDYYGPWTGIDTSYNEEGSDGPTEPELRSQAKRNLSGRSPVPIEVRVPDNSGVILSDALTINMLIPGVRVPLRAHLGAKRASQLQKIDHVTVTETSDGEIIQITLSPASKNTDSDVEIP